MMKEERFKSILGVLLVPVLILAVVGFCMGRAGTGGVAVGELYTAGSTGNIGTTLEERGYVMYQSLPQGLKELIDQGILEPVCESAGDDDAVEGDTSILNLDQIERGEYLGKNSFIVGKSQVYRECLMSGELSFDPRQGKFTSEDQISKIEAAGFTGFGEQLKKVAQMIQYNNKIDDKWVDEEVEPTYYLSCQGVEFSLVEETDELFRLNVQFNFSSCYAPAKYQELVKDVESGGEYFLYASTVGGEIETLTFCKDNAISLLSSRQDKELSKIVDGKRIVFMFRDGKLVDYYMTVQGGELELDDSDKHLIDRYTKGLGKGYPAKVSMTFSNYGIYHIYRAG